MAGDEKILEALAGAVADGEDVDWETAAPRLDEPGREVVRQLRLIAAARPGGRAHASDRARRRVPFWTRVIALLAGTKVLLLAGLFATLPFTPSALPIAQLRINCLTAVVFGACGAMLWYGGRRDRRAVYLGTFFLLVADAFSWTPITSLLGHNVGGLVALARAITALPNDAFLTAAFGLFVGDFPRTSTVGRPQRAIRLLAAAALAAGTFLFVVNLVSGQFWVKAPVVLRLLWSADTAWYYWDILFVLGAPLLPLALWKARFAAPDERRRVRRFALGLMAGLAPILATGLWTMVAPAQRHLIFVEHRLGFGILVYGGLLSIPVTATLSVLVHRVLEVRLIVRRALQYVLARYTLAFLILSPFVVLARYFWVRREETLATVLSGGASILLPVASAGVVLLAVRGRLLSVVDRRFFRENRDSRRSMAQFAEASRGAGSVRHLAMLLRDQIEEALHPERIAILVRQVDSDSFAPLVGWVPSLACDSALVALLAESARPLDVDMEAPRGLARLLPERDQQWLVDADSRLICPLRAADRSVFGLVVLGEKKSELPYSVEDRLFLSAVMGAAAIVIENRLMRITGETPKVGEGLEAPAWDEPAAECEVCHQVVDETTGPCACGGRLVAAALPRLLLGKFRVERRVGAGGMGVVYKAVDLALDRVVAVKTLPRVTPEESVRLRREARAMAAVVHPNLALVFGVETWRGLPVLIVEFLHGGTLRDRLRGSPMTPIDAVDLGIVLADTLHHIHRAGVLHRDVKPSNIGFQADGTVKLLDFGLARMLSVSAQAALGADGAAGAPGRPPNLVGASAQPVSGEGDSGNSRSIVLSDRSRLVGTPLYMAPEAILNQAIGPSLDLWSLALVLYEAVAGCNPFRGRTVRATIENIASLTAPDIRSFRSDCHPALAAFLRQALVAEPRRRPGSAAAFASALRGVRQKLA